jgi:sortase B
MKMKIKMITASLVLLIALTTMGYAGYQLIKIKQIYQEGSTAYHELIEKVRGDASGGLPAPQPDMKTAISTSSDISDAPEKEKIYIPNLEIDFEALKSINEDAVAWLYCPDTVIDYPVMRADDYSYYLYHLADGTRNVNGSIFIDYNCPPDFSGNLTVIYGHHMKSGGMMFGSLEEYKNQKYYNEHPFMYLYTEKENYRIDLLYGFTIGAGQWRDRAFMYEVNAGELLSCAALNTTFESDAEYAEGDRIIAMSTCSYDFDDARYVLIGILKES